MSNFDLFANLPSWRTWTKDKERRDKKMKVVSVNSGDSVPCCDQGQVSPVSTVSSSPVMSPPRWLTPMTTCLFEADFSARPAPPQPRPAQLRPVSYLFSKPTSKLETKLRLISTDLVCSGYFVIFSKPEIGEAVNIWFCWELKSTSTNLTVLYQRVVELCWWPRLLHVEV